MKTALWISLALLLFLKGAVVGFMVGEKYGKAQMEAR